MALHMERDAVISKDGLYRYELTRRWTDGPTATFVMLNPSTADANRDDATIRRCVTFARDWHCGALRVVNLYAWRATDPKDLAAAGHPVGPLNDWYLSRAADEADREETPLVAAWGAHAGPGRVAEVRALPGMQRLAALAFTKGGQPRHPLYLPAGLNPRPYVAACV